MRDLTAAGPNEHERTLVWRCILESETLIGDIDDIWSHISSHRALVTMRLCVEAIGMLVRGKYSVQPSFVKSIVMQTDDIDRVPFLLEEMSEFLVADDEARAYWHTLMPDDRYPHECPFCGAAAFIGCISIDCKAKCH